MSNTSATGGYLLPTPELLPGGITLQQYLQEVIVGITGFPGPMVRPKYQTNPPKQPPQPEDNYITFSIATVEPDANVFAQTNEDGDKTLVQRHVKLFLQCSIFGPDCQLTTRILRDGFQIAQNRDKLTLANIGFTETQPAIYTPELVGERWFQRIDMTVVLKQEINSTYDILSFKGASGEIKANNKNNQTINVPIIVQEP